MKISNVSILALLASLTSVNAATASNDGLYRGCISSLTALVFQCPKGSKKAACSCKSPQYLASFMDCLERTKEPLHDQIRAQETMIGVCEAAAVEFTKSDLQQIYQNATQGKYFIPLANVTDKKATLYNPVTVKLTAMENSVKSFKVGFFQKYIGELFGGIILAYWGAILLIGALINFAKRVAPNFVLKCNSTFWKLIRQKVATPAAYGYSHSSAVKSFKIFNMAIPTRPQSLVLLTYGIMHLIMFFPNIELFHENTRFPGYGYQISRYAADRSGLMAMGHLPLIFLFAGRNNIMITLTGWSFETFNAYHRWIARGMYIDVFIHSVSFSRYEAFKSDFPGIYEEKYVVWGLIATICGGLIMFFSLRHFRDRAHEFFLITHWLFISLFLAGVWWHLEAQGYMEWLYAAIAIWGFDRVARLVRIVVSGLNAKAEVQLHPHNVMKFKIDYSNVWTPTAGTHVYVTFLRLTSFWQSHPFSVYRSTVPGEESKMIMCVRKQSGVTKTIAQSISSSSTTTMPILIDGPYGQRFPLANYSTVVFISGGIGSTAAFSYIDGLIRSGHQEKQRLVFIWAIRNRTELNWFKDEIQYLQTNNIELQIFITNQGEPDPHDSSDVNEKTVDSDSDIAEGADFNAIYSKPNVDDLISTFVSETDQSIAFYTCGPPLMNDDTRASVTKNISVGKGRVEFFEESFAW